MTAAPRIPPAVWKAIAWIARKLGGVDQLVRLLFDRWTDLASRFGGRARPALPEADFLGRLERLLGAKQILQTGGVHLVGLSKFRRAFGADWEKVRDRVHRVASKCIARHLARQDIFTRHGDEGYLIVFASLSREAAQLKCVLIAEEISKRLMGDLAPLRQIEVKTVTGIVDRNFVFEEVNAGELIRRLLDREYRAAPRMAPDVVTHVVSGQTTRVVRHETTDPLKRLDIRFIFRPIWFTSRNVVSSYYLVPTRQGGDGESLYGINVLPEDDKPRLASYLDCTALSKLIHNHERLAKAKRTVILGMSVHFPTVAHMSRQTSFNDLCNLIPKDRRRLIIFELTGAGDEVPPSRLVEIISFLKPFCRAVLLRLSPGHRDFQRFRGIGLHAVGIDIWEERVSEADLLPMMQAFAENAASCGLKTYVHGLTSTSQATAAICAGFDYVDGDAVISFADAPKDIYQFRPEDLFANLIAGAR